MEQATLYTFRKSVLDKPRHFQLLEHGLSVMQEGWPPVIIPYRDIRNIRVFYQPFRYRTYNYTCVIRCVNISITLYSTSYKHIATFEDCRSTYTPFVRELVRRKNAADKIGSISSGQAAFTYYGYIALTVSVIFGLSVLFMFIPFIGTIGVVTNLIVMLYYLPYIVKMFIANFPKAITDGIVPDKVLPTALLS